MVLVDASLKAAASWQFDAEIAILTHSTTIAPKYQARVKLPSSHAEQFVTVARTALQARL